MGIVKDCLAAFGAVVLTLSLVHVFAPAPVAPPPRRLTVGEILGPWRKR